MTERTRVLIALGAAVAFGGTVAAAGNASLLRAVDALAPLGVVWVNAIRMTVLPLIVSVIVTGVASVADIRAVGRLGAKTLLVFLALLSGVALVAVPVTVAIFGLLGERPAGAPLLPAGAAEAARLLATDPRQTFSTWLVSLVPQNPVAAA